MKFSLRNAFFLVAFCSAAPVSYAQGVDTIVEVPTTAHSSALIEIPTAQNLASNPDNNLTLAGEYKSAKNVVEEQKPVCWNWYADFGYVSEYNFRGTNLTPDADGALILNAAVSKWGFTLGFADIYQLGTAHADSWSIGEGGGGGHGTKGFLNFVPETTQDHFNEIDVYLQYHHEFGPVDVTVGNMGFFIDRNVETFATFQILSFPLTTTPVNTVGDEQFDRVYIRIATSVIPHIQPWIQYYQTIYSEGQDKGVLSSGELSRIFPKIFPPPSKGGQFPPIHERNNSLGGYLEGRLRGNFQITPWLDFNPFGIISVSFHDRTEPVENPVKFHDFIRAKTLSGWNVAQAGCEFPIHLFHVVGYSAGPCAPPDLHVDLVPSFTYSYHISRPPIGTDRDEIFGGAKIALTF